MATRKTATKTTATPKGKSIVKTASKPATDAPKRAAPVETKPTAAPAVQSVAVPVPRKEPSADTRPVEVPTGEARYRWIAYAAYLRAEKRGFTPGREIEDWLAAEADFAAAYPASKG
jgi:hypothetical protein